jgi:serine/threonine protein kinase/tetratricopeptide (TPR) repeat protein
MPENTLPPDLTDPEMATPSSGPSAVTGDPSVTAPSPPITRSSSRPLERGESLGRYIVLSTLGEGGMGIVYSAYDPELDRRVAVKLLRPGGATSPERQARLLREAQALARVSHPNVIAVYDVGTHRENVFVAMELVEGGTLTDWLEERRRTTREVLQMFCDAGRGLAAAHSAGLIHRDFKPENVLVGKDGRVRVTDFGLARLTGSSDDHPIAEPEKDEKEDSKLLAANLTRAGAVVGTPLFMSWEQFAGRSADARSDQYNFCASLYWALFGVPPPGPYSASKSGVAGGSTDGGSTEDTAPRPQERAWAPERIRDLPKEPRLPAPCRRALLRGLSLKPEDRFPSMDALLRELARDPRVAQRRWILGIAGSLAIAAGAATYSPLLERQQRLCRGADRKLDGIWTASTSRAALERAFSETGAPQALDVARRVSEVLDRYSADWVRMHTEACEATRIRGEQSDQVLSLRMICLDSRLQQLQALTAVLGAPDLKVVDRAYDAVHALPSISGCADVKALLSVTPRPTDPATLKMVEDWEKELARARALQDASRHREAYDITTALMAKVPPDVWPPLRAELLEVHGWLTHRAGGDINGAERTLKNALVAAEEGHDESEKVRILQRLVFVVGYGQGRYQDAIYWGDLGRAVASRLSDERAQVELLGRLGSVYLAKGDAEPARSLLERAAVMGDRVLGRDDPSLGVVLNLLAEAYLQTGDHQRALELLRTSLGIVEKTRGPESIQAANAKKSMAMVLYQQGSYQQAYEMIQSSISTFTKRSGPDHPEVADALDWLASILHADGLDSDALVEARRALEIKARRLGPDHVDLSYSLINVGQAQLGLKKPGEALPLLERALKLQQKAGLTPKELSEVRFAVARALWDLGKDKPRATGLALAALKGYREGRDRRGQNDVQQWLTARRIPFSP